MQQYVEKSVYSKGNLLWIFLGIIALGAWCLFQIWESFSGRINLMAAAYFFLFTGLFIWRYGISYTYTLTEREIIIQSHIAGFTRICTVPLQNIELYSDHYKRSLFRRLGMRVSRYQYQYCGGDGNATRVLLFIKNGKKEALLFKAGNVFMEKFKELLPGKYLDASNI